MSLSDSIWLRKLACCLLLTSFIALIVPDVYHLSDDAAWMYMPEVAKHCDNWGSTKDWSSLLFVYETRMLNEALRVIFPSLDGCLKAITHNPDFGHSFVPRLADSLHAFFAIQLIHAISLFIFVFVLGRMVKELLHSHPHGVFIVVCLAVGVGMLRFLQYFHFCKDLDSYFTYLLLSACIALRWLKNGEKISKKTLFFVAACLLHCICYRKNAICILPVFSFLVAYYYFPSLSRIKLVFLPIIVSCVFIGISSAVNAMLPSQKTYPQNVMMFSTLKNMAILTGDQNILSRLQNEADITFLAGGEKNAHVFCPLHFADGAYEMNAEKWTKFLELYVNYLKVYPREFVIEKIVTIVQFYTNGYIPIPVRRCASYLNPSASVRPDDSCWNHEEALLFCSRYRYDKWCIFTGLLFLLGYVFIRRLDRESEWTKIGVISGLVGIAYSLSFWIVTPTPNTRYHSLSVFAACMSISLLLPLLLSNKKERSTA